MDVRKIDFNITIEIEGAYLVTESNSELEVYSQLHSNAWDALEHFNDSLMGYISIGTVDVEIMEGAWIQKDRRNNP